MSVAFSLQSPWGVILFIQYWVTWIKNDGIWVLLTIKDMNPFEWKGLNKALKKDIVYVLKKKDALRKQTMCFTFKKSIKKTYVPIIFL